MVESILFNFTDSNIKLQTLMPDNALWDRISIDDQEAYTILYRYYFPRFYNYGKKFITDELLIEDAAQETMLLIWEKRFDIAEIKNAGTYFYITFRNILISKIRKLVNTEEPNHTLQEPGFDAETILLKKETNRENRLKLEKALSNLTPRQREAIFLRFYESLSYDESAEVLGITTKANYKIVARAMAELKKSFLFFSIGILKLLFL